MEVYGRSISHGILNYRKNTLLRFGECCKLIGSIILLNPGSASVVQSRKADLKFISKFYEENHNLHVPGNIKEWSEYNPDPTMRQVEKIFSGWYINLNDKGQGKHNRQLNGVVQLFNLFDVKNPNLGEAIMQNKQADSLKEFFCEHTLLVNKPVYLGWGNPGLYGFPSETQSIFNDIDLSINTYLKPTLRDNRCYHPGYINRSYKCYKPTIDLLTKFYLLFN